MKRLCLIALLLPSCSFIEKANEAKAHGRIDLLFPLNALPGLEDILPHIVLDIQGGFEWHNAEDEHRFEMEKLRFEAEKQKVVVQPSIEEAVLAVLRK